MPHWCADETRALLYILAYLPFVGMWLRGKYIEWKIQKDLGIEHKEEDEDEFYDDED